MAAAERYLVDESNHLARLFMPPCDHSNPNPGYIMGYPPGLRENGGQYTHGSLWMAMARARMGDGNAAVHLLQLMNPVELTRSPDAVARYRVNPTLWRQAYLPRKEKLAGAEGRGTQARLDGCIESGSRRLWDSSFTEICLR